MKTTDKLIEKLKERGVEVTRAEASKIAVRVSGSVEAYLAELIKNEQEREQYHAKREQARDKFKDPIGYEVEGKS